ncbi:hypothetical protein BDN72DRAFT_835662 [Pluteus cervinus]|uniref:Uncharacterized protein n=1 Tax=Pluteus cervinus TaxID=181527 RepID=A0ACD3B485_9AGAR|nr:hypothetical protein BDN72DRAFT_835662 [Pluteus cervinus]
MSLESIPPELIARILKDLQSERATLCACSLSSSLFTHPSQRLLYSSIRLRIRTIEGKLQEIHEIAVSSPHVLGYIESLRIDIEGRADRYRSEPSWQENPDTSVSHHSALLLGEFLPKLARLKEFHLGAFPEDHPFFPILDTSFPLMQFTHLSIGSETGDAGPFPVHLLGRCPKVTSIRLSSSTELSGMGQLGDLLPTSHPYQPLNLRERDLSIRPKVVSLTLGLLSLSFPFRGVPVDLLERTEHQRNLLRNISRHDGVFDASGLKCLLIQGSSNPSWDLSLLEDSICRSLEKMDISLWNEAPPGPHSREVLPLQNLTCLQCHVTINNLPRSFGPPMANDGIQLMIGFLKNFPNPSALEFLDISFLIFGERESHDWKKLSLGALESLLFSDEEKFKRLCKVGVTVAFHSPKCGEEEPSGEYFAQTCNTLRTGCLRRLAEKGILEIIHDS